MPVALLFPLLLRAAGPIAFIGAAIVAGVMNRSFILIPLLALAATATTIAIRKFSPSPAMDLQAMLSPDTPPQTPNPLKGSGKRLGLGLIGYGVVFGLAALIAALFQTTEFEPQLMVSDAGFLIAPALVAFIGAWVSARIGLNQMAGMMGQMQDMFVQMQTQQNGAEADEGAFTFEGEIVEPDEDKS